MTDIERFWSNVSKAPGQGPKGDCWEWQGARLKLRGNGSGNYGQFVVKGKHFVAHRWIFQQINGLIARGLKVLHRCDNPPCCRPEHLFKGTQRDNMLDCTRKGRNALIPDTPEERSKLARNAVKTRWAKKLENYLDTPNG